STTVHPGLPDQAGTLSITGNYTQYAGATLEIDVTGAFGGVGFLNVQGLATLGGAVVFTRAADYTPPVGTTLNFMHYGLTGLAAPTDFDDIMYLNNTWTNGNNNNLHFVASPNDDIDMYRLVVTA